MREHLFFVLKLRYGVKQVILRITGLNHMVIFTKILDNE